MIQPVVPLPKSMALWFVDNTSLTFIQISEFTGLHLLEVESIANDETSFALKAINPIDFELTTKEIIKKAEDAPDSHFSPLPLHPTQVRGKRQTKYTPLTKRMHKPDAIAWLIRHHPELSNIQIIRLIGTTKNMIESIRDKTYWNVSNLNPRNPVDLSLCSPSELQDATDKALASEHAKVQKST